MSKVAQVLKNKNRVEKLHKAKQKEDMAALRAEAAFKARLYDEMQHLNVLFDKDEVESIEIEVHKDLIAEFSAAIYSEDLAEYDIKQSLDAPNIFTVRRKFIAF